MSEIKKILEEQLEREKASAKKDLNIISFKKDLCPRFDSVYPDYPDRGSSV